MSTIKEKAGQVGHNIAEAATKAGHKIAEGTEKAADWVKEKAHAVGNRAKEAAQKAEHAAQERFGSTKTSSEIREHMDVISSCGCKVGKVDRVEGDSIKLTKADSPDGQHHLIPKSWVASVDEQVHLSKNAEEVRRETTACCG